MPKEVPQYVSQLSMGSMPQVQYSNAQAEAVGALSDAAFKLSGDIRQKANDTAKLQAIASMRVNMSRIARDNQADPAALQKSFDGFKRDFTANLPPDIADEMSARFDIEGISYIDQATVKAQRAISADREYAALQTVDSITRQVRDIAPLAASSVPEHRAAFGRNYQTYLADVQAILDSKNVDGTPAFTPQQRFSAIKAIQKNALEGVITAKFDADPITAYREWSSGTMSIPLPNADGAINIDSISPSELFNRGVISQESGGQQFDASGAPIKSMAGAIGIAQVMPETAKDAARFAGLPWDEKKYMTDPAYNKSLGKAYFDKMKEQFGSNTLALMAYNAGPGAVEDFMNGTNKTGKNKGLLKLGDPRNGETSIDAFAQNFPFAETRKYVESIGGMFGIANVNVKGQFDAAEIKSIDKSVAEMMDGWVTKQQVSAAAMGLAVIDPTNKKQREAVDYDFQQRLATAQQRDPNADPVATSLSLIKNYGIIPDSLRSTIRGQIRSADPQQLLSGVDSIEKLRQTNPALLNDLNADDLSIANYMSSKIDAGYTPEQAIAAYQENEKIDPTRKEARKATFKKIAEDSKIESLIKDKYYGIFGNDANTMPEDLVAQTRSIAESEYVNTGDKEASLNFAVQSVGRTWGQTGVGAGGQRWEKFAPEKFYAAPIPVDNAEWMNEQLVRDVSEADKLSGVKYTKDNLKIVPTGRMYGGKPTYSVFHVGDNGVINKLAIGEWHPDWETSGKSKELIDKARMWQDTIKTKGAPSWVYDPQATAF